MRREEKEEREKKRRESQKNGSKSPTSLSIKLKKSFDHSHFE